MTDETEEETTTITKGIIQWKDILKPDKCSLEYITNMLELYDTLPPEMIDREDNGEYAYSWVKLTNCQYDLAAAAQVVADKIAAAEEKLERGEDGREAELEQIDGATEEWLIKNIVFLNNGFYDLHEQSYFKNKQMCNDFHGDKAQIVENETGNGFRTIPAVDRIKHRVDKLSASGGMGWMPVALGTHEPIVNINGKRCVNTYHEPDTKPVKGDTSLWVELVEFICGEYAGLVLDHMAFTVQYPEKKIIWQVMVYDNIKRNGKSACFEPLLQVLGDNAAKVETDMIEAGWGDAFLCNKAIVFEEIYGIDRRKFNTMKTKFANGGVEQLNIKGGAVISQVNLYSMYLLSNHEDAMHMDSDEGKLLVINAPGCFIYGDTLNEKSEDFYRKFWNWIRSVEGKQAAAWFFMNRDVSKFAFDTPPVRTEALMAVCESGASVHETVIRNMHEDHEAPFDKCGLKPVELYERLKFSTGVKSVKGVEKVLRGLGYVPTKGQKWENGENKTSRLWAKKKDIEGLRVVEIYDLLKKKRTDGVVVQPVTNGGESDKRSKLLEMLDGRTL